MAKSGFTMISDTLTPGLKMAPLNFHLRLRAFTEFQSNHVQDHMRLRAPWTDRTGNARNGLFAAARDDGHTFSVVCYHTVPYGVWLEVKQSGKFAIVTPTLPVEGKRIMSELTGLLPKLLS